MPACGRVTSAVTAITAAAIEITAAATVTASTREVGSIWIATGRHDDPIACKAG